VFSNVRSAIISATTATTFLREGSAISPAGCIKEGVCRRLSSKKGDGQENRRLVAFSFRFLGQPIEKRAGGAQECAQTVCPKRMACGRDKALLRLRLTSKATV
jgi:hypothetical protein